MLNLINISLETPSTSSKPTTSQEEQFNLQRAR